MFSTWGLTGFSGLSRKNKRRKGIRWEKEGSCCCFSSSSPNPPPTIPHPPRRLLLYWLAPQDLLSLFSYTPQDHQSRGGTTHNGLPPATSITKKMHPRRACGPTGLRANHMDTFSSLSFLSSDSSSLCQADKTWTITQLTHLTAFFVSRLVLAPFL